MYDSSILCCRMFITRLNPLLGSAVALQDSSRVAVSVTPRGSIWPSNSITLQVQPLKVSVGQGAAVTEALQGLASIDKRLAPSGGVVEVELSGVQAEVREDGKVETRRMDLLAGERCPSFWCMHCPIAETGVHVMSLEGLVLEILQFKFYELRWL